MSFKESEEANFHWDFKVEPKTVLEYVGQVLSWTRLCMLEDAGDGFSGTEYWQNNVLIFSALQEDWAAEAMIGFEGQVLFDALATKLDAPRESEAYQNAHRVVWRMLTKSSMHKITHGKNLTKTPALGVLWDEKEHSEKDIEPGTFAELLRYGTIHFEQTRETIEYMKAQKPAEILKKGLLEP